MTSSGSYDFNDTRNEIIDAAFRKIGLIAEGETASDQMVTDAAKDLNRMVKGWNAQGIHIWKQTEAVLFLDTSQKVYSLGSTGDRYCLFDELVTTAIGADEAAGQTALTVDSITGIASGDIIGIALDDDTMHWTTVNGAPSGSTVTVTDALASAAADGNAVYAFTSKGPRPLQVLHVRCQIDSTNETEVTEVGSEGYFGISNKSASGVPVQFYYKPSMTNGKFYLWPTVDNETYYLNMTVYIPIEDFDASGNNPDLPVEWHDTIVWNLAKRLLTEYGVTDQMTVQLVLSMAEETFGLVSLFDTEEGDIIIGPDFDG